MASLIYQIASVLVAPSCRKRDKEKPPEGGFSCLGHISLNDYAVSLNDLGMLNSFLDKIKDMTKKDFQERLDKNDKEFSIEKDGVEEI